MEEVIKNCQGYEDIVLLLALEFDEELFKIINDYEIYGEKLKKLWEMCSCGTKKVASSLEFIDWVDSITKEIVHKNLSFEEPVPFLEQTNAPLTAALLEFFQNEKSFYNRYTRKLKEIENNTSR